MIIRTLTIDDVDFAQAQIQREGWVASRAIFESILEHDPAGCFVAEIDGQRVAMLTTARFGRTGWIGHFIVLPEQRKRGIGTRMMKHAIDYLRGCGAGTIRIEADPPGMRIYQRLGFLEEYESLRFRSSDLAQAHPASAAPLSDNDLDAVLAFDRKLFGEDRSRYLKILSQRTKHAFVLREGEEVTGYLLVMPTREGVNLGPFMATSKNAASELLNAASRDGVVTIGLPEPNQKGATLLRELGFESRASSMRMFLGPRLEQDATGIYGIANGATG